MLRVVGEVDLTTVSVLETTLAGSIGRRPAYLVVDLSRLYFCSAQGMGVLFNAGTIAADRSVGYAISGASACLDRIWETFWPDELPDQYDSAATAVHAIRARHARSG